MTHKASALSRILSIVAPFILFVAFAATAQMAGHGQRSAQPATVQAQRVLAPQQGPSFGKATEASLCGENCPGAPRQGPRFGEAVIYSSGGFYANSVAIGDVNGDGRLDLVVAHDCQTWPGCNDGGWIDVLLGNGDGTFQAPVGYGSGGVFATSVALADLRGDGRLDVVVANKGTLYVGSVQGPSEVGVLLGNGDGTFQAAVSYSTGAYDATSIAIGDLNGDGKPDLVVANAATCVGGVCSDVGEVSVLLGNGDGTFQAPVSYNGVGFVSSVAIGDLRGIGKLDLVVGGYGYSLAVLLGNGDGTFQAPLISSQGVNNPVLGDLNGDGKLDLVTTSESGYGLGLVGVLLGNGDGTFQAPIFQFSGGYGPSSVAIGDVNGDSLPDLVVANGSTRGGGWGVVGVLLGNGDGTFQNPVAYSSGGYGTDSVAIGDLNGDAKLDVVFANQIRSSGSSRALGEVGAQLNEFIADTVTKVTSSLNPSEFNQPVTLTATVTSNSSVPNGSTVTFYNGASEVGTAKTTNGVASLSTFFSAPGKYPVKASYPGDVFHKASSGTVKQVVNPYPTSTSFTSSLNPSIYGQSVTFRATVTPSQGYSLPTGRVNFISNSKIINQALLNASGVATITRQYLGADTYSLTAVYVGDAYNASSTSTALNQVVKQTTSAATITSSLNPSTLGQAVTFRAKITSPTVTPTGPVTFKAGTTVLGTMELSGGKATLVTSSLPAGSTKLMVVYNGDSNIAKSSASVTQVVQP